MASSVLGECLDLVIEARMDEASARLTEAHGSEQAAGRRSRIASVAAFGAAIEARHAAARRWSELARVEANDAVSRSMASAAEHFSSCLAPPGEGVTPRGEVEFDPAWPDEDACIAGYFAIESSMSEGRLVDAERFALDYLAHEWVSSAQAPLMARTALARALVFQGRVAEAAAAVADAVEQAELHGGVPARMLAASTSAYVEALRENPDETERLTAYVVALDPEPRTYIPVGSHLLCAFGLGPRAAVRGPLRSCCAPRAALRCRGCRPSTARTATSSWRPAPSNRETCAPPARGAGGQHPADPRHGGRRCGAHAEPHRRRHRSFRERGRARRGLCRARPRRRRAARCRSRAHPRGVGARRDRRSGCCGRGFSRRGGRGHPARRHVGAQLVGARTAQTRPTPSPGGGGGVAGALRAGAADRAARRRGLLEPHDRHRALPLGAHSAEPPFPRSRGARGHVARRDSASLGRSRESAELDGLTTRQQQVAGLVAEGCSNRTISERLGISDKTVEKHIQAIFARWHVSSRTGIANRVLSPLPTPEGSPGVRVIVAAATALVMLLAGCTAAPEPRPTTTSDPRPAPPPVDPVQKYADDRLSVMTLDEKISSMLMVHVAGLDPAAIGGFASANHLGGVILMGDNIPESEGTLASWAPTIAGEHGLPILIATDQEGGVVRRLYPDDGPSAAELRYSDPQAARAAFADRGALLAANGVTVNFGIIADVTGDPESFIFDRSMGATPGDAAARVAEAVLGEDGEVYSTLKHFPGHGVAPGDSHSGIPTTAMSLDDWRAGHEEPFAAGIDAGAEFVMFGHLQFDAVDPVPATLSARWHAILRDELGFEGIAITDDMNMLENSGRPEYANQAQNAVLAVAAGNTMLLYVQGVDVPSVVAAIHAAVDAGTLDESLIDDAARRLLVVRRTLSGETGNFVHCFEQCQAIIE